MKKVYIVRADIFHPDAVSVHHGEHIVGCNTSTELAEVVLGFLKEDFQTLNIEVHAAEVVK